MPARASTISSFPRRILVVEDSPAQASALHAFLTDEGYEVTVAADGRAALAAMRSARPALILADVNMPVMNGFELCRFAKGHPAFRTIPLVLLTTLNDPRDLLEGLAAGADAYLFKPYNETELRMRLAAMLETPSAAEHEPTPIDFAFDGHTYRIAGGRRALDFLLTVYQSAQRHNHDLRETKARLSEINARLEQTRNRLWESEKIAAIGQLAAGVAHQINNPIAYVNANLRSLSRYLRDFLSLIDAYEARTDAAGIEALRTAMDLPYARTDALHLIDESLEGTARVAAIVQDVRRFSNLDAHDDWRPEDLHAGIDATLHLIGGTLAGRCEVRREFGALPLVECNLRTLNELFSALLANSADAMDAPGVVIVRTALEGDQVCIEFSDNGSGMPPEVQAHLFEPFFTTKPAGRGTGLGLSMARSVVHSHHGTIEVESAPGHGTTVRIRLPVRQPTSRP